MNLSSSRRSEDAKQSGGRGDSCREARWSGATSAQIEALYRDRFEHFVRVATAIGHSPEAGHDVGALGRAFEVEGLLGA